MAFLEDLSITWKLLLVAALVALNGFFVASEFAIVKIRSTQLAARLQKGDRRAKIAQHVVNRLDEYLSATQLGITLASLGLGWVGEPAIASLLEPLLHAAGVTSEAVLHTTAFVIAFSIITFLHIVLGELAPKNLAIQRAEGVTLWTARPLHWFYVAFKPFIWSLNAVANLLLRLVGVSPASDTERTHSEEELRLLFMDPETRSHVKKERADLIVRVFNLKNLHARNVMTPRTRIVVLDQRKTFEENLAIAEESGYTRFPLVEGDLEHVAGMVHYRDLANLARAQRPRKEIASIRRSVLYVPESTPVEDLLGELLRRGVHMAIVLDEFGSTAGLVTLEDIFEELFGEIRDEFDTLEGEALHRDLGEGHFLLEGHLPLHQASAILGEELSSPDVTTLSGYIVSTLGRLPLKGERLRVGAYEMVVRELDRRRIQTVEAWRREPPLDGADD